MATYKVLQDIEAEDKLLGPLSMRQFIYAIITVALGFIIFRAFIASWYWLILFFLPPMVLFGVLAAPFGHDQSSEIWLLAKIRFFLKPHRRIWDQSGLSDLVTINAPRYVERNLSKNLSQYEVKSRLRALADTIDSRGWAIKNVDVNMYAQPVAVVQTSDRLIDPSTLPQEVPTSDVTAADDIMDAKSNPTAQMFDQMIAASTAAHRQQVIAQTQGQAPTAHQYASSQAPPDYWFLNQTAPAVVPDGYTTFDHSAVVSPGQNTPVLPAPVVTADEQAVLANIKAQKEAPNPMHSRIKTIQPLGHHTAKPPTNGHENKRNKLTATPNPAILDLANNDDLNVATIARQAEKSVKQPPDDEVIVPLR